MKPTPDLAQLLAIMAALRQPETGCPWDIVQTFETIAPYTLEEAQEVAMPSAAAISWISRKSWAICCFRWCFMLAWPRSKALRFS